MGRIAPDGDRLVDAGSLESIDVIMATRDGARTIGRVFEAWRFLEVSDATWRAIVVDNGSTDETGAIIRRYSEELPIEYLFEGGRGKNRALNRALEHVQADLVVFTDDDAVPGPEWLQELLAGARSQPEFEIFGGAIRPLFDAPPPDWLDAFPDRGIAYAITDPELGSGPVHPSAVWGANMAILRQVFDGGHRFAEDVGPAPGRYIMGSETEFNRRMVARGCRCWFQPEAVVGHIIRSTQFSPAWIRERAYCFGRREFRIAAEAEDFRRFPELFGLPRWLCRQWMRFAGHYCRGAWKRDLGVRIGAEWKMQRLRGYAHEYRSWVRERGSDFGPGAPGREC